MHDGYLEPAGLEALLPPLAQVTHLDLRQARLGDEGARLLARSEHLRALRFLDLRSAGVGPAGARALHEGALPSPMCVLLDARTLWW